MSLLVAAGRIGSVEVAPVSGHVPSALPILSRNVTRESAPPPRQLPVHQPRALTSFERILPDYTGTHTERRAWTRAGSIGHALWIGGGSRTLFDNPSGDTELEHVERHCTAPQDHLVKIRERETRTQ